MRRRRLIFPKPKALLLPAKGLVRPATAFERRMQGFGLLHRVPPLGSPEAAHLQRVMDSDVMFQQQLKTLQGRIPHIVSSRLGNGSGLQLSNLLRSYFLEYAGRYFKHGPESFPTSFNVVESFLRFDREHRLFDLRDEVEHLLFVDDYFRWYEKREIPEDPLILKDIMPEGTIYSYEMIGEGSSFRISGVSQQVFAGVSLVRHALELSCLLLAGEDPPLHSDADVPEQLTGRPAPGREQLVVCPGLTTKDRYLDCYPSFAKVILLARFDLAAHKYDVRYVNLDLGQAFAVLTDDLSILRGLPREDQERCRLCALDGLERYDTLFSALSSMIYLPAFFAAHPQDIHELEVVTELEATRDDPKTRETIRQLRGLGCTRWRSIRCLTLPGRLDDGPIKRIEPPPLEFRTDGYWKVIGPQEIGEDKTGKKVFGRTWVSRHESWSARSPQSFLLRRNNAEPDGPDPGEIYIQRCPAHELNLYKVGLTRRGAEIRSGELTAATGVPMPFGVLSNWKVGDCARVEKEVHFRLEQFRINPRREFFRAPLPEIVQVIQTVLKNLTSDESGS